MEDIESRLYWTKGYEAGVEAELKRIRAALRDHAATRDVFEILASPFHADEIDAVIMKGAS